MARIKISDTMIWELFVGGESYEVARREAEGNPALVRLIDAIHGARFLRDGSVTIDADSEMLDTIAFHADNLIDRADDWGFAGNGAKRCANAHLRRVEEARRSMSESR